MFWNEDRIKWYLVASEYTKYHDNMTCLLYTSDAADEL